MTFTRSAIAATGTQRAPRGTLSSHRTLALVGGILGVLTTGARPLSKEAAVARGGTMPASAAPPVRHVFVIVLENEGYGRTFGHKQTPPAPYLADSLVAAGALL